jgi:predicted enzyme related to lactoylglutathione lyase
LQRITVVSVPVSDQETAKAFYVEKAGFEIVNESRFGNDLHWIQLAPRGDVAPSITLVTWFDTMAPGSLRGLVIDTDDLHTDYEVMSERGVSFLGPPAQQPGGIFATFVDPDGNQVSLRQADSSTGESEGLVRR